MVAFREISPKDCLPYGNDVHGAAAAKETGRWSAQSLLGAFTRNHWTTCLAVMAMAAVVVLNNFSGPLNQDEIQYLSAAALIADHSLYEDFFYSQTPYFPVILASWSGLIEPLGLGVYGSARLFNAAISCGALAAMAVLVTRVSRRPSVAALIVLAMPLSSYLELPFRTVRNDSLPLLVFVIALLAVTEALRVPFSGRRPWLYAMAGVALGVATMTKQSYAFPALGLFLFTLFFARGGWRERFRGAALPLGLGGLIGGMPGFAVTLPLWETFSFSAFTFHRTAHLDWILDGRDHWPLSWKLGKMREALTDPAMIGFGVAALGLAFARGFRPLERLLRCETYERGVLLLAIVLTASLGASFFLAAPMHPQYAAPLFPVGALVVAVLSRTDTVRSARDHKKGLDMVLGGLGVVVLLLLTAPFPRNTFHGFELRTGSIQRVGSSPLGAPKPSQGYSRKVLPIGSLWLPENLASATAQIRDALAHDIGPGKIRLATLQGGIALEAGFQIDPALAGAPFFYRSNDAYSEDLLARMNGTSPDGVADWLATKDARALLIADYDEKLHRGFHAYARKQGMVCHRIDFFGLFFHRYGQLYLDPALSDGRGTCDAKAPSSGPAPQRVMSKAAAGGTSAIVQPATRAP